MTIAPGYRMLSQRDLEDARLEAYRQDRERNCNSTAQGQIYSRQELVDFLRRFANGFPVGHDYADRFRQAADEIAKRDADVYMGRTDRA